MNSRTFSIRLSIAIALVSAVAHASGIDPTHLSLPKGPASIEGLGRNGCTESENGKTAAWLLCERDDLHGHSIKYAWDTTDGLGLLQSVTWNTASDAATLTVKFTYENQPRCHRALLGRHQASLE
jgi:hypothetical protein